MSKKQKIIRIIIILAISLVVAIAFFSLERKRIKGIKCATCRQLYRTKHLKDKIKSEKHYIVLKEAFIINK